LIENRLFAGLVLGADKSYCRMIFNKNFSEENMNFNKRNLSLTGLAFILTLTFLTLANAQNKTSYEVLADAALTRVVPTSFYFAGQSAVTQVRNAAAAKIGKDRFVVAGMVDTSGYSTEISGKYEGFLITDSPIKLGTKKLGTGAYGFGFAANGQIRIFDLSSKEILSAPTKTDTEMKRPRPLQMTSDSNGIRLYKGKSYVVISRF
jgi:hypothetical protein